MREFWEAEHGRIRRGPVPVDSDAHLYALEDAFVVRHLEEFKPRSLLDIGCGNGRRTARLAQHVDGPVLGIDYSPAAIGYAKELEDGQLKFRLGDFETVRNLGRKFDCVLTCRVLINLAGEDLQVKAIEAAIGRLREGGRLLMMEASRQGEQNLNRLRRRLRLPPIGSVWHNTLLDERAVLSALKGRARVLELERFGIYYVLTRALLPLTKRSPRGPEEAMFEGSVELQEALEGEADLDVFGRHLAIAAQKTARS